MSKDKKTGRRSSGALLMTLGGILMAAALALAAYNAWDEHRAQTAAREVALRLEELTGQREDPITPQEPSAPMPQPPTEEQPPATEDLPDYIRYPDKEMPLARVNGRDCLGLLEIPALDRTLPVLAQCDDASLKYAPGCYTGSVYTHDIVIAGHNYVSHFAKLRTLQPGAAVYFTDLEGNRFAYQVADLEKLEPTDIEGMTTGDWDLTLFTCTYGNRQRIAVRCFLAEP